LSKVQNNPYQVGYTSLEQAKGIEANFEKEGNEFMAGLVNLQHAIGGSGWLDEDDDGLFDIKPEAVAETLKRVAP
jgi:hypothetical protein